MMQTRYSFAGLQKHHNKYCMNLNEQTLEYIGITTLGYQRQPQPSQSSLSQIHNLKQTRQHALDPTGWCSARFCSFFFRHVGRHSSWNSLSRWHEAIHGGRSVPSDHRVSAILRAIGSRRICEQSSLYLALMCYPCEANSPYAPL